jgi:hypothetical protein
VTLHPNARLTPFAREQIVHRVRRRGWRVEDVAQAAGVSTRTAYRWLARHRALGVGGLGTVLHGLAVSLGARRSDASSASLGCGIAA